MRWGCFATGVTVVTCVEHDQETPAGLTVNSFTSGLASSAPRFIVGSGMPEH